MGWLQSIPWILSAASALAAALLFFQLRAADERIGAVEHSLKTVTEANDALKKATQSRAATDRAVRQLAPADKLERLR